jgi:capsular polysaccharide biosynthesis protein
MEIYQILEIIKKRLALIIVITLLFTGISAIYSYFYITPMYKATTTLIVGKMPNEESENVYYSDILSYQMLVKTYVQIAKSEGVAKKVIDKLYLNMPPAAIQGRLSASPAGDTEVMYLSIVDDEPERAARIANGAAEAFVERVKELMRVDNVQIIDAAEVPSYPFKPNKRLNVMIGMFLGMMVSLGIVFLLEFMDSTLKGVDDVENILELPVVGIIPMVK